MSSLQKSFEAHAEQVKNLARPATNEELSQLYGLYKQATLGDNNTPKPGLFDLKGKAKWEAWNSKRGLSKEDAQKQYIDFVRSLSTIHP